MPRTSLAFCLLASLLAQPASAATDLRIQLNPALAALHAEDPARAEAVLKED
jgi:hypothetical protein